MEVQKNHQGASRYGKRLLASFVFALFFVVGGAQMISAQNMSGTVVEKKIKFARGKSKASARGSAKYAMSYVYKFTAKANQQVGIHLAGKNPELKFSLIRPDQETIESAFTVSEWSGKLPQSGTYSIVVVMNDSHSAAIPYTLDIAIE
jgi:hypothetical protein